MGTYVVPAKELIEPFDKFLQEQEGDVGARAIAEAWNKLAKKHGWNDKLKVYGGNE